MHPSSSAGSASDRLRADCGVNGDTVAEQTPSVAGEAESMLGADAGAADGVVSMDPSEEAESMLGADASASDDVVCVDTSAVLDEQLEAHINPFECRVEIFVRALSKPGAHGWKSIALITRAGPGKADGAIREVNQGTALAKMFVDLFVPHGATDNHDHVYRSEDANVPVLLTPRVAATLQRLSPDAHESWLKIPAFGLNYRNLADKIFAKAMNVAGGSSMILSNNTRSFVVICFVAKKGRGCARYIKWTALVEAYVLHTEHAATTKGTISFLAIAVTDLRDLGRDIIAPRAGDAQRLIAKCEDAKIVLIERSRDGCTVTISIIRHDGVFTIVMPGGSGKRSRAREGGGGGGGGSAAAAAAPLPGTDTGFAGLF